MNSTNTTAQHFIATVILVQLDETASECGDLVTFTLPTIAKNAEEAIKAAAAFYSEGGDVVFYPTPITHRCATSGDTQDVLAECQEPGRWLTWKVTRCLAVTQGDFERYVALSERLGNARVCKDLHNRLS